MAHSFAPDLIEIDRAWARAEGHTPENADYCAQVLTEVPRDILDPLPLLTGDDLTAAGYKPGPEYKGWLGRVRAAQYDGEVKSKAEALELVARLRGAGNG